MAAPDERVRFLDLPAQHAELKAELIEAFSRALDTAGFIGGPAVAGFERNFAAFVKAKHAVAVASGTDALRLALLAMGIKRGDRVITVPNTFIATTEAISQAGAEFVFVDVDRDTALLDPNRLEDVLKAQRGRFQAVVPVHLYGQTADMEAISRLAGEHGLLVLEDAAQAHGAEHRGRRAGGLGRAAAFSFYPGKNLGACGEGGAITTDDGAVAEEVRMLRTHGEVERYRHVREGYNARLDAIQAAFLDVKLKHLERWNEARRKIAARYDAAFAPLAWVRPVKVLPHNVAVRHLYVIHVPDRDGLRSHLTARKIETGLHYPTPLHLQACYAHLGFRAGAFPNAEESAATLLSLPMDPGMTESQVERVVVAVRELGEGR